MKKTILSFIISLAALSVYAQPANDVCSGAQAVTPNGTCVGGTTVAAGDHWIGTVGCQSGNHIEVWYSFVATNTQLDITVTNGTMTGNIEFILVESTGPCSGLSLQGSLCGASPLTGSITSLTIGVTYYYTISSSTSSQGTFTTCVNNVAPPPPAPGQDCPTATILCASTNFSIGSLGAGTGAISGNASNENLSALGCLLADERQSQWYKFTVGQTGTIEFLLNPNTNLDDIDWAIYNITTSGCALTPGGAAAGGATQVACNFSGCPGNTGILNPATDPCTVTDYFGCAGAPATCQAGDIAQFSIAPPTLVAGQTYAMVIDNYSVTNGGFAFTYGATQTVVMGQPATFASSLDATCMIVTVDRTPFYTGTNSTYLWNYGDGFTSTAGVPGPHTYGSIGTYTVSLTVTDAVGCVQTFSQTVNIGCILPVTLTLFDAQFSYGKVNLNWITETEINNNYFTVERSTDGILFEAVSIVKGAGNSNNRISYSSLDLKPKKGISYYRLKQTDYDGNFEYFEPVAVSVKNSFDDVLVYPNPVTGNGFIEFSSMQEMAQTISIYDISGRVVYEKLYDVKKGGNKLVLETTNLTKGMYFIRLADGAEGVNIKFIKE